MDKISKALLLLGVASILGACSGGGGTAALPVSGQSTASQSAGRFISSTTGAQNDGDFRYLANPPIKPLDSRASPHALPAPSTCVRIFGLTCYTPLEIRTAYNVPSSFDGSGQTIVIVDAYGSPTIQEDLQTFDAVMGLPNPALNVIYPSGQPTIDSGNAGIAAGWAAETSLDVEWSHAIAPAAKIELVVAPNSYSSALHTVEQYAIEHHLGNVISMSFGASEQAIPGGAKNKLLQHADSLYQQAKAANITMIASAGDSGATNGQSGLTANFPASDPLVTAVGGTTLFMSDSGVYQHETVWNDTDPALCPFGCVYGPGGATGGAPSILFKAPSYQQMLFHPASREVADVSYNASDYTAILVYIGGAKGGFYFIGGTSAGAPQWAGIVALADQARGKSLGFINQQLYNIAKGGSYASAFHDVTVGQNGLFGGPGESAGPGYDMPTGLGSPNVSNLINALSH